MGMRHALGASQVDGLELICLADLSPESLRNAEEQISHYSELNIELFDFVSVDSLRESSASFDVAIIATTAQDRHSVCNLAIDKGIKDMLIEKPLGQSKLEVEELIKLVESRGVSGQVNFGRRLYGGVNKLKDDFLNVPQLQGEKVITMNTGAIGIGANGIHYIDMFCYLLDAVRVELVAGEIESNPIKSGRGSQFEDNGGWCTLKFYNSSNACQGRAHISITAGSSAFGTWSVLAPHALVTINELERQRIGKMRKEGSTLPVYRYAGDYRKPVTSDYEMLPMEEVTKAWLEGLMAGENLLPSLKESVLAHTVLFDWLELNEERKEKFPIT